MAVGGRRSKGWRESFVFKIGNVSCLLIEKDPSREGKIDVVRKR